jgi:uncharacterized membrane protein
MAVIYTAVSLGVLMMFASLGVDLARVQMAKTELRCTADAAARAAAASLSSGVSASESAAMAIASANTADGNGVTLQSGADIEFGTWDNTARTFTVLSGANRSYANAVRVTARRIATRGTAVPLVFAQVLGRNSCDVTASSVAWSQGSALGFVGLNGITVKNNLTTAIYDSSSSTDPSVSSQGSGVTLASNDDISGKNNNSIGGAVLGPSGTNDIAAGFTVHLSSALSYAQPSFSTTGSAMNVSGTTVKAGGTYYISDLAIANNAELKFSGPATLYISGDVNFAQSGTITAYNGIPANLVIYQKGTGSFGGSNANNVDVTADIYAPGVDFSCKNGATFRGRAIFGTIYAKNNLELYYDSDLTPVYAGGTGGIVTVR